MFNTPIHLGPIQFDQPQWLALLIPALVLIVWWGRQSLSGMGTISRRVALVVRVVVVLLLLAAVAKPHWRREAKNVTLTVISDLSESVPKQLQRKVDDYLEEAAQAGEREGGPRPDDQIARVTVARDSYVQALPGPPRDKPDSINVGATDGTNLAEGLRLSMAVMPSDKANRLLIASDGNETAGDLLSAASAAKAKGIPIDVLPLRYKYDNEVTVERIVAPSTARVGQNINLRVLINSQKATRGRLSLFSNGVQIDLDPASEASSRDIDVPAGLEAITVPLSLPLPGPQEYRAVFEPLEPGADAIKDNNTAMAVTFVSAEGRVLVLAKDEEEVSSLIRALRDSKLAVEFRLVVAAPTSPVEVASYDGIVIANSEASYFSQAQQELLKSYVYDLGGGLVMVGGPDAFGAGGWTGSPLAEALPIKLDPPAKRQMPRGALVLVMHSCEMPNGNYWGKKTAETAVNNLTRLDMAGIIESTWQSHGWTYPLSEIGNKAAIMRAINSMTYGDAYTFDDMLQDAYDQLLTKDAGAKHIIVISDGDPQFTKWGLLGQMRAAKISVSTILVYPHSRSSGGGEWVQMRRIAKETGGTPYSIIDQGDFAQLPSIFIKESTVVKRSLRWEGTPFAPKMTNVLSDPLRGIDGLPAIGGYVVAADREGLSVVSARGKENDPILAHWQFGLGKAVAFTSDAGAAYAKGWPSWDRYRQFWEQHVRWAMRPSGTSDIRVATEDMGDTTKVVVDALDPNGDRLNFVRFRASVLGPENKSQSVELRQVGPGRYEGVFDSARAGAYIANIQYQAPASDGGAPKQGNIQTAVTRPFAKEFRTLQDNAGLLKLVAERTGGRVLGDDARSSGLWSREGLKMPVALRSIWLQVAIIGMGLFLVDVAVRRVRIDPRAMVAAVRRAMNPARSRGSQQTASLKEVRRRAQEGIKQRADLSAEQKAAALAQARAAARSDEGTAKVKFEASAEELTRGKKNIAVADPNAEGPSKVRVKTRDADGGGGAAKPTQEEGIARLRKAKERAREELDDDKK